jgi:hypothetical protein
MWLTSMDCPAHINRARDLMLPELLPKVATAL